MANTFQKFIYNTASLSLNLVIYAIIWFFRFKTLIIPFVLILIFIEIAIIFFISFNFGKSHLSPIKIDIKNLDIADKEILEEIILYVVSVLGGIFVFSSEKYLIAALVINALIIIFFTFSNNMLPNPILWIIGYHFYRADIGANITGGIFISKRKLRNTKGIKTIYRFFDFLYLDTED